MLNIAVVGVGTMGVNHARNYHQLKNVKLVGVCDKDKKRAKEVAGIYNTKYYFDHEELIEKERLDAVSIAVPTSLHKEIALDFIKKGISVLVEKPLASTSRDAKLIVDKAKDQKVILAVGHVERFNPAVIKLKSLINQGKLGNILSIVVKRVGLFPPRISDVDVVTDLAVHDLDIITNLVGMNPFSVYSKGSGSLTKGREDHAEIFLDYGHFGCFIQVNWITPIKVRTLSITGTKGYAELNYVTQKIELYKSNYKLEQPKGFKEFVVRFGEPQKTELDLKEKEPLRLELENFIRSILGRAQPRVKMEEALNAIFLANSVIKSIKTKKVVKIR